MDLGISTLIDRPSLALLAGSALLAGGFSVLLAAVLFWIRSRRLARERAEARSEERPTPRLDLVDEAPAPTADPVVTVEPRPRVDLGPIDLRLEEVESQLERLHARIDAIVRQRESRNVVRTFESLRREGSLDEGSDEERALREMVARGH